jgi:uncharacterized protein (TIGR02145 family)
VVLCAAGARVAGVWSQTDPAPITIDYPFNPDANVNGAIDMIDLLEVLSVYATSFSPTPMTIDGVSVEQYLVTLTTEIMTLQAALDSVASESWGVADVLVNDNSTLTFVFSDGTTLNTPILVGPSGPAGPQGVPGEMGPAGPAGGDMPDGIDAGEVAVWTGSEWVRRQLFSCPYQGSCNYSGKYAYATIPDVTLCIYPSPNCPFTPCDDGNSLTFNDVVGVNGECAGEPCGNACSGLPCDDGDATTYADAWNTNGTVCAGYPCTGDAVDCAGAGPCAGVPYVLFDAKAYPLVEIGTQCWFKENLASDSYRNGDPIPGNLTYSQWADHEYGAQAVFGEIGALLPDVESNLDTYGRLYNWLAVSDARELCPVGFHVSSDEEWNVLAEYFGGSQIAGTALKSTQSDTPAWDGNNLSGFSAVPGGNRWVYGDYGMGYLGSWWSRQNNLLNYGNYYRVLYISSPEVSRDYDNERRGFSVRCVRD